MANPRTVVPDEARRMWQNLASYLVEQDANVKGIHALGRWIGDIYPSTSGSISKWSPGGVLFDYYVLLFGSRRDIQRLTKHLNAELKDHHPFDAEAMFKDYASCFWFFAAQSLYAANQKCNRHLLHVVHQFEYRGLSRVGRQLGSYFGIFPAFRNQDIKKQEFTNKYAEKVENIVESNNGILTWDNYCHQYGSPTPSTEKAINYKQANYTVAAVTAYVFEERPSFVWRYLDNENTAVMSVPRDPEALMPVKPLIMEKIMQAFASGSKDSKDDSYSFFNNSLLLGKTVNTVPMTTEDEEKKSSLQYGERGYKHFHPWFLADLNPSSVDQYFQFVMEILPFVDPIIDREEYWFFRADINILMMWYRMIWASNNFLHGRISLACPVMEFFHPYKKLLEDVWRRPELFYTFFAPLCHWLNPNSPVKVKPKLKFIESYFTMLRLLWPEYRAQYRALLTTLKGKLKIHLQNILLIFEFFIPIAHDYMYALKTNDYNNVMLKLRQSLIAFAILGSSQYVDMLLLQFGIWEYQEQMQHPVIDILKGSIKSFVGEDIELFNRLLSQHSKHNSRRAEPDLLDKAYKSLGYLVHAGMDFNQDLLDDKSFLKGNRRYTVDIDSEECARVRLFLNALCVDLESGEYLHYYIPHKPTATKQDNKWVKVPTNMNDYRTMNMYSQNTGTEDEEAETSTLMSVYLLSSYRWCTFLNEQFDSLLNRKWQFKEKLKESTIERFLKDFPHYVGEDRPIRRERKHQRKRRRQ